ncbi:MAG: uracil-DNA glycosylase [Actinomycetota bacterium]
MQADWAALLQFEFEKPYFKKLQKFIADERKLFTIYPQHENVYRAFELTSYADTRVVILGQDPYHGVNQANGLCFSVQSDVAIPPSLRNVLKELQSDLDFTPNTKIAEHGNLEQWARQGVLMLNTTLTVRAGEAGSHQGLGWESFTDEIIRIINNKSHPVVFVLWGAMARKKRLFIDTEKHHIVDSAHPSPLSAHNGFIGSRPFTKINDALVKASFKPINWRTS